RDFQLLKEELMNGIDVLKDNLTVCKFMLEQVIVHKNVIDQPMYDYLYSVEEVNKLVLEGIPFRNAYQQVGQTILSNNFQPERKVVHSHEGSIGNLCLKEIETKFKKFF